MCYINTFYLPAGSARGGQLIMGLGQADVQSNNLWVFSSRRVSTGLKRHQWTLDIFLPVYVLCLSQPRGIQYVIITFPAWCLVDAVMSPSGNAWWGGTRDGLDCQRPTMVRKHGHLIKKKLSSRREAARCFVSLDISLSYSTSLRSLKMTPFDSRSHTISYWRSIVTMTCIIFEIRSKIAIFIARHTDIAILSVCPRHGLTYHHSFFTTQ